MQTISMGLRLGGRGGGGFSPAPEFNPASLFAASEPGGWYDPSDLTTLFQDRAGTTPVTSAGQLVGLRLDKSKGLVLGPELISNGGFDSGVTGFTGINATLSASGGSCVIMADGVGPARASQTITTVVGKFYEARATLSRGTGALNLDMLVIGVTTSAAVASSTPTEVFVRFAAVATTTVIRVGSNTTATAGTTYIADNISVKELPGHHLTAINDAARGTYNSDGTLHWIAYDGVNTGYVSPTITPGTDKAQVFAGVRKLSDAVAAIAEFSINWSSIGRFGSFAMFSDPANGGTYSSGSRGSAAAAAGQTAFLIYAAAPSTAVLTATHDITADLSVVRQNGVSGTDGTADQGTGNFLAYPLYVGRRGGTTLPFNGRDYGLIVRFGPNLDAATIGQVETYLAAKSGVTI